MLHRRHLLQALAATAAAPFLTAQVRKPNFVIFLADDLGYGDIGCFGSKDVPTPHIDSLARNGVKCTSGYVSAAVCSPSRAALLTGRYQQRFGFEFNTGPAVRDMKLRLGLPLSEKTLPQYLKAAGYTTGMVGKWHLGGNAEFQPPRRGFDEFFGFHHGANAFLTQATADGRFVETEDASGALSRPPARRNQPVFRGETPVDEDAYLTDAFAREATAFLDRHHGKPFFLYMPFNAVHTPLQTTAKYLDRVASIQDERHRMLAAMTVAMDDAIGAVLSKVKQYGLERDTLIVFLSDNGCPTYTRAGTNGPLSGSKITYFEGGIRVPFLLQWQGRLKPGQTYTQPVVSRDLLPTLLTAAGVTLPTDRELDGVDLLPYLEGKKKGPAHEWLFWRAGRNMAVRHGDWKLLRLHNGGIVHLYNLAGDVGEREDLAAANPAIVKRMQAELDKWSAAMKAPLWAPRGQPKVPVNGEEITWDL
ncbi:MAG: sulfatase [Bryobacterales bacterium]|nr:sulfatase [Bryobacterales bacterium]